MTGETPTPERNNKAPNLYELQVSMREVINVMRDVSRNSGAPDAHRYVSDELIATLQVAADHANGALIEAGSEVSSYYFLADEQKEKYERGRFQPHLNSLTPFYGIQRGIEELTVEDDRGKRQYLCLAVDPLYTTFDHDITSYFANRGRVNILAHPFGLTEHSHQRLWVPLYDIGPSSLGPLHLPGKPVSAE